MIFLRLRSFLLFFIFSLAIFSLNGCKDDNNPSGPGVDKPTIVSFTATPSTISATGDTVTLTWKVTGATSLSIAPGVGDVTPADSGSKKVFVTATTTFILTATNSAGSITAQSSVNASPAINVSGYVKDSDGMPISGVTVLIKGKSPVISNSDGSFTVNNVTVPYDASIIQSSSKIAFTYMELTRPDPTLLYLFSLTASKEANISGVIPLENPGERTKVFFISGDNAWSEEAIGINYALNVNWRGTENALTGKLYILRWKEVNGIPSDYTAYASKELTVSTGGGYNNQNFTANEFTNPAEQNIGGSIISPTGYMLQSKKLYLNFGNAFILLATHQSSTADFNYIVPSINGFTFGLTASALNGNYITVFNKKGITAGSSGISINLIESPKLNLPANNGIGIDTTTQFLWSNSGTSGINIISFTPSNGPTFFILCADNSCNIPNLAPQGMGLPSNAMYSWNVYKYFPFSSINDAAGTTFIKQVYNIAGDNGFSGSQIFHFTTK